MAKTKPYNYTKSKHLTPYKGFSVLKTQHPDFTEYEGYKSGGPYVKAQTLAELKKKLKTKLKK